MEGGLCYKYKPDKTYVFAMYSGIHYGLCQERKYKLYNTPDK